VVEIKGRWKMREWGGQGSCFLEVGCGKAAFVKVRFFAEPRPEVEFHHVGGYGVYKGFYLRSVGCSNGSEPLNDCYCCKVVQDASSLIHVGA
jgi:hypothetical protein